MSDTSALPPLDAEGAPSIRLPLRFVWQSDDLGVISGVSPELLTAMGPDVDMNGRTWDDLILRHGLDPSQELAQALARRETWSGVTAHWPLRENHIVAVELAGLPVFDRERNFRGFRGFGVAREAPILRLDEAEKVEIAASGPAAPAPPEADKAEEPPPPVLPFRIPSRPGLNGDENIAFREIARALNARTANDAGPPEQAPQPAAPPSQEEQADYALEVLENLPAAVLVHRFGTPLFANHAFLDLTGFDDLPALIQHGLDALFEALPSNAGGTRGLGIRTATGRSIRADAHLKKVRWQGETASLLFLGTATTVTTPSEGARESELRAILDTATDGILVLDANGRILSANRGVETLFGYDAAELDGRSVTLLLNPDSHRIALDYLEELKADRPVTDKGREVVGAARRGAAVPLLLTLGRLGEGTERFCAVLRDIAHFRKVEQQLREAKREAEHASAQKSAFLARVSHEVRTPMNAIIGFTEVMMEQRFGPIGSERYRQYLQDIHDSGGHIISLINDLLDLAKIEAGRLDLNFARVNLNEAVTSAVAMLQPQANASRIIIRTALTPRMPPVIADPRSIRQIVLNLVSNAVKYTPAGGQAIVSTVVTDLGQAVVRVRDTGAGMNEQEIAKALEPFRQLSATTEGGTGLGLPLTKALTEANRAKFVIQSAQGAGTLVEVIFPPDRVLGL